MLRPCSICNSKISSCLIFELAKNEAESGLKSHFINACNVACDAYGKKMRCYIGFVASLDVSLPMLSVWRRRC